MIARTTRLLVLSLTFLFVSASGSIAAGPSTPFELIRSLDGRGYPFDGRRPINALSDYNGDGIQELAIGQATFSYAEVAILDGRTGAILRTFRGSDDADSNFIESVSVTPDFNGDGLQDMIVGDSLLFPNNRGRVFSFFTAGPGGSIEARNVEVRDSRPWSCRRIWQRHRCLRKYGRNCLERSWAFQLVNVATGSPIAQLNGRSSSGFGFSVAPIGDVNGDEIEDWISSDPNVSIGGLGRGEIYVLSGAIATSLTDWTSIDSLPSGGLIATLRNTGASNVFLGASRESPFANLGDPAPVDGLRQQLLVSGGANGFVTFVDSELRWSFFRRASCVCSRCIFGIRDATTRGGCRRPRWRWCGRICDSGCLWPR